MHDDSNGLVNLGYWTSLTKSNEAMDIVLIVTGNEVSLQASSMCWVLFMGYIPHKTRLLDPRFPTKQP
jgi:hypothetical protein